MRRSQSVKVRRSQRFTVKTVCSIYHFPHWDRKWIPKNLCAFIKMIDLSSGRDSCLMQQVQRQTYSKKLQGHLLNALNKISHNEWAGAIRPTCRAICVVCGSGCAVKAFWTLQTLCHAPRRAVTPCRAWLGSAAPHNTVMSRWTWSSTDCCLWRKTPRLQSTSSEDSLAKRSVSGSNGEEN